MTNLLFYTLWVAAAITVLLIVIGLLPPGDAFPYPQEIEQGILNIVHYAQSFNQILPLDTLLHLVKLTVILLTVTRIAFPLVAKFVQVVFKMKPGNS